MDDDKFAAFLREFAAEQRDWDDLKRKAHEAGNKIIYDKIAAIQREARRDKRKFVRAREEFLKAREEHLKLQEELERDRVRLQEKYGDGVWSNPS